MPDDKPPGTMQLPRGAKVEDLAATVVPPSNLPSTQKQVVAPPMPADWRYEVKSEIARGGMGRVVEAEDTVLGRTVALKEALAHDAESIRRFQRETRITAKLEHPSIVPVHDAGTSPSGSPFYVMRKVSGEPLEGLVAKAERLDERLALLPHVVAAARAIAHAHERGIVHRDIKPSNILVGELGETIVIDWGLAKAIGEAEDARSGVPPIAIDDNVKTRAGIVFGTPGFMAPEQIKGTPADEKCDVYALGATLYHLLARRPPHYDKNADEMMKSAANGPPAPLRELLPGVPAELSTIVDKALAHDRSVRYPNARELAEDLNRFLTGQLVASHRYSRRERLVRFVRKNRALVGVSAAAALAMAIGGSIAVARVVAERDQANAAKRIAVEQKAIAERERASALDNFNKLELAAARTKTSDDPTRAIAMVSQLATESSWRQARAIGAAARAHGVAFGMPAAAHVRSLEMSRDGQRVLAAGDDGSVRIYDLGKRTQQTIAKAGEPAIAQFADGEHSVVIAHGDKLAIIDVAANRQREVQAHGKIARLVVSGPIAYWTDEAASALWKLDVASGTPEQLPFKLDVQRLAASPDGRWIAVASDTSVQILDRTQPTLPPQSVVEGAPRDLDWSADGAHLVVLAGDEVIAVEMPSGTIVHRQFVGHRTDAAYVGGQVFATGPTGIGVVSRGDSRTRHVDGVYALGLHEARGGIVVAGGAQGVVAVISPDDDQILRTPGTQLERIAASANSPWIVGAGDGVLLAWNVDAIEPHRLPDTATAARFVSGDQLVVAYGDAPALWIDLRTDKATPIGVLAAGIRTLVPAPDGTRAIVIDGTRHAAMVSPAGPQDLEDVEAAAFLDEQRYVFATHDGHIRLGEHALYQHSGLLALAARRDRVTATFSDRIWRQAIGPGGPLRSEELPGVQPTGALAIAANGDVVFGTGKEVHAWRVDGTVATLATFDRAVSQLAATDAGVLAVTDDSAVHTIGSTAAALAAPKASIADSGLVVAVSADGVLEVIDPLAQPGEHWPLARGRAFGFVQIAPDGSRVLAVTPTTGVLVWPLALPTTRDATASWLDGLTNAIANPDGTIRWR